MYMYGVHECLALRSRKKTVFGRFPLYNMIAFTDHQDAQTFGSGNFCAATDGQN